MITDQERSEALRRYDREFRQAAADAMDRYAPELTPEEQVTYQRRLTAWRASALLKMYLALLPITDETSTH
jgi:hypothetical protein